jgi:hypothetical protein
LTLFWVCVYIFLKYINLEFILSLLIKIKVSKNSDFVNGHIAFRTLADIDGDGQLKAEEFILAMHLTDMAKAGQPLPLTLPPELVPPSFRSVSAEPWPASPRCCSCLTGAHASV